MTAIQLTIDPRPPESDTPHIFDYIHQLCSDFVELRGDRRFADDAALVGGIGRTAIGTVVVMGHQKGHNTRENVCHNLGIPCPGYRKARRLVKQAAKFRLPLICFIDTPGAQPDPASKARGQARAIAECLMMQARLKVPIISVVIGEGSSGGALAMGMDGRLLRLEHTKSCVAASDASAPTQWRDATRAREAANMMRITAQDLLLPGVIDEILPEPAGGAHTNPAAAIATTVGAITHHLDALRQRDLQHLLWER